MSWCKDKTILITGGAGFLGRNLCKYLINRKDGPSRILIMSRSVISQQRLREECGDFPEFILGDVTNFVDILKASTDCDIIVHAAAQKYILYSEYQPLECVRTNVDGSKNVIKAALYNKVPKVLGISTDKAVDPINVYGMTKYLMEKMFLEAGKTQNITKFYVARFGNYIGSDGSVIPAWRKLIDKGQDIEVARHGNKSIMRYMITIQDVINVINRIFELDLDNEIVVPYCSLINLQHMAEVMINNTKSKIKFRNLHPAEKCHEFLYSMKEVPYMSGSMYDNIMCGLIHGEQNSLDVPRPRTSSLSKKEIRQLLKQEGWL